MFFFSQKNTEEQNTQHSTETLSQPISQNLTAIFSSNALWPLYAEGLLWARNCAQKCSVNSVCSVREKTHQRERKTSPHTFPIFFFSQKNTDEQNTQRPTETLSLPISQSVTANLSWKASVNSVCRRRSVGSNCAQKAPWTLCALWEKNLPSELHASHLVTRVRSISHRFTQMNRTHSISQRH